MLAGGPVVEPSTAPDVSAADAGEFFQVTANPEAPEPITSPDPIQVPSPVDDLPPFPPKHLLPERGECVVIKPGEPTTVRAERRPSGALVTTCRHYQAFLPHNSRTWAFRLLYAAGIEIYDPKVTVLPVDDQTAQAATLSTGE
jgi:hypothetical protein